MKVHATCAGPAEVPVKVEVSMGDDWLLWVVARPVPGDRSAFVPQDREQVLRIAGGLCTALLAAHSQGVAHLDVKADNVLLDTNLNVQLADWGTAAPLSFTAAQWRERGIM